MKTVLINEYFTNVDKAIEWANDLVGGHVPNYPQYIIKGIVNFQFTLGNMIVLVEYYYWEPRHQKVSK